MGTGNGGGPRWRAGCAPQAASSLGEVFAGASLHTETQRSHLEQHGVGVWPVDQDVTARKPTSAADATNLQCRAMV